MKIFQLKCLTLICCSLVSGCYIHTGSHSSQIPTRDLPQSLQPFITSASYSATTITDNFNVGGRANTTYTDLTLTLTLINGETVTISKDSLSNIDSALNALATQSDTDIAINLANNILSQIGLIPSTSCG